LALIVLKIDVDTLRGTREGVPTLVKLLRDVDASATFLFSLGPDHTGWALRRVFRPGFLKKVSRTSVVEHYGLKTLMYGTLLPGPDIGVRAAAEMRAVRDAGFEVGIHCWDHVYWQDNVRSRSNDARWTCAQMQRAYDRFVAIFGSAPSTHGAAGWQMNEHGLALMDKWGMTYASDGRGEGPYRPMIGERVLSHVQMPTTLPTLDELIGVDGVTVDNVADHVLRYTAPVSADSAALQGGMARAAQRPRDHVFTLHAELEGQKLSPVFDTLLRGWRAQGHQLVSMADYHATLDLGTLPVRPFAWGSIPGRSGELMIQPGVA
jgi:peptidoglycan/xylan/chitin deacetylase (PgdA/CDA1 family)